MELRTYVRHKISNLRFRIQDFNALGVWVVANSEWTRDGVGEFAVEKNNTLLIIYEIRSGFYQFLIPIFEFHFSAKSVFIYTKRKINF